MKMEVDALRAAHDAPHRALQHATSALHGQLDDIHAQLRWTERQLAQANTALEDAQRERDSEMAARTRLDGELEVMDGQLQSLEADYRQLRASSKGEAGTRAAADHARAEARQLKAMLMAQSADLDASHRQRADEARRLAAAAAEISTLRGTCARKDAALRSAEAAAHKAASEIARFMQRDAQGGNTADQLPMSACGDPDLSAPEESMSCEEPSLEHTYSEGYAEQGQVADSHHQVGVTGGVAHEEAMQLGTHADQKLAASPEAAAIQLGGMQAMLENDASLLAGGDHSQHPQRDGSSPIGSDTSKRGAICFHDQHDFMLAPLTRECAGEEPDQEEPGQHQSRRGSHSKGMSGYNRGEYAYQPARPKSRSERRGRRSRSHASTSSRSKSRDNYRERRPRERSSRGFQRAHSPSSRHRHSPSMSPSRRRSRSPRKEWRSRHFSVDRSARQEQHGCSRRHISQSPAGHHTSDRSSAHSPSMSPLGQRSCSPRRERRSQQFSVERSARQEQQGRSRHHSSQSHAVHHRSNRSHGHAGQGALPGWGYGQPADLRQHNSSMPGDILSRDILSASRHAAHFDDQKQAKQGTGWSQAGVTEEMQDVWYWREAVMEDPAALG